MPYPRESQFDDTSNLSLSRDEISLILDGLCVVHTADEQAVVELIRRISYPQKSLTVEGLAECYVF